MAFIREYVYGKKDGKRFKKGVLFGTIGGEGVIKIGFSSCSPRDEFDRIFGNNMAVFRAEKYMERFPKTEKIPYSIREKLPNFINRCKRYFKTDKFPEWLTLFSKGGDSL